MLDGAMRGETHAVRRHSHENSAQMAQILRIYATGGVLKIVVNQQNMRHLCAKKTNRNFRPYGANSFRRLSRLLWPPA